MRTSTPDRLQDGRHLDLLQTARFMFRNQPALGKFASEFPLFQPFVGIRLVLVLFGIDRVLADEFSTPRYFISKGDQRVLGMQSRIRPKNIGSSFDGRKHTFFAVWETPVGVDFRVG